jgi:hypothetical protein
VPRGLLFSFPLRKLKAISPEVEQSMQSTAGLVVLLAACLEIGADDKLKTENVILVTLDGLRWQEMFTGADEALLNKDRGGVADVAATRNQFWRDTAEERRTALLPFLWTTMAKEGQVFGNPLAKGAGRVTNGLYFSYPGYNELLCGFADPKVASNAKIPNSNVTILEWLNSREGFKGRVAAFTSWDVFPYIINEERSGIPVDAGLAPLREVEETPEVRLLNRLIAETPLAGEDVRPDAFTFHAARLYLVAKRPRLLFVSFDETDTQGHAGRYDRLLASARKADGYLRELWETAQAMPEYKGTTTLIVTTDHGRGDAPVEWKNHGANVVGAEAWWVAVLGPDTPPLGERSNLETVGQNQVAATIARLLGFDYLATVPSAGKPLPDVVEVEQ